MKSFSLFSFFLIMILSCSSLVSQTRVPSTPDTTYSQAEPYIAVNPTDSKNMVISCISQISGSSVNHIGIYFTRDGGSSWYGNNDVASNASDPVVAFDGEGSAYLLYQIRNVATLYLFKSTDGGEHWNSLASITGEDVDRPWMGVSQHPNANGYYDIFVTYTDLGLNLIEYQKSTDGGNTFSNSLEFSSTLPVQGSMVAVGVGDTVFVAWAKLHEDSSPPRDAVLTINLLISDDRGENFGFLRDFSVEQAGAFADGLYFLFGGTVRLDSYSRMAVDNVRGTVYVAFANHGQSDLSDIMIYKGISISGSYSWTNWVIDDASHHEQWSPAISVSPDGVLSVLYYENTGSNTLSVRLARYLPDGNLLSNEAVRNPAGSSSLGGNFLGDYIGVGSTYGQSYLDWTEPGGSGQNTRAELYFTSRTHTAPDPPSGYSAVRVSQVDQGDADFGQFARWRLNKFVNYTAPQDFVWKEGSSEVLRASQDFKPSTTQRHNLWNIDADVRNHRSFSILSGTTSIYSQFKSAINATIQKLLIDGGTIVDSVQFKDPWLTDYADPNYGYNNRNQGMSAPFRVVASASNNLGTTSTAYKGVFVNQLVQDGVFYSARIPQPTTLGGLPAVFMNWSASNASLTHMGAYGSAYDTVNIVFTGSNATVTANYKLHLGSNSSAATASNNQRKIGQTSGGTYCLVYESANRIWFTTSSNGSDWSNEVEVSSPDYDWESPYDAYPSLVVYGSIVNIVWQHNYYDSWEERYCVQIKLRRYNVVTDTWYDTESVTTFSAAQNPGFVATPVIDAMSLGSSESNDVKRLAWSAPDGIKVIDCNYGTWSNIATVQGTDGYCKYPSIVNYNGTGYALAWLDQNNDEVRYIEANFSGSWSFSNAYKVSPDGWTANGIPSMGFTYPYFTKPTITWQGSDNVTEGTSVHVRQRSAFGSGSWEGTITSFSMAGADALHPVVGSVVGNGKCAVVWSYGNSIYAATYNGSSWSGPSVLQSGSSGGTDVNINTQTPSTLMAIWHKPNHEIAHTTSGVNPNSKAGDIALSAAGSAEQSLVNPSMSDGLQGTPVPYRLNRHGFVTLTDELIGRESSEESVSGVLAFEIAGMKLTNGAMENQEALSNPVGETTLLSSKVFTIPSASSTLVFSGAVYGMKLSVPPKVALSVNQPIARVVLRDAATTEIVKTVWDIPFSELTKINAGSYGEFKVTNLPVGDLADRSVYLDVQMLGKPLIVNDYLLLKSAKSEEPGIAPLEKKDKAIPCSYTLYQNFPNPFNPATTIAFDLPHPTQVSLRLYNTLGEEIRTLADREFAAGEHTVTADLSDLPSGVYLYRIVAGTFRDTKRMVLVK
ncbi:MAG: T9SS type A sorting domain-containing protein [Bacteroidota bacterium]